MKKILCILVAALLVFFTASCSKDENIMSYGKGEITAGMYTYLTATYKASFLETYNRGFDTEDFWKTEVETENGTVTYRSYIEDYIFDNIARMLVSAEEFDRLDLELSDEAVNAVDSEIGDLLKSQSEQELNESLALYGIDRDTLRKIKIMQTKSEAYFSYMYENEGEKAPSVADLDEYLKENYRAIGFVTVYTDKVPILDDKGEYKYNDDGNITMVQLSEKEKKQKKAIIENVMSSLENGASYDEVKEFSDEDYSAYEYGILLCKSDVNSYGRDIIQKAMKLKAGEFAKAENDGTVYIMVCLDIPSYSGLSSNYSLSEIYSNCTSDKYYSDIDKIVKDSVSVNKGNLKEIDITKIKQNKIY